MSETQKTDKTTKRKYDYNAFDGLTETQISAAEMLQSGRFTKGEVAEKCGIHPNTMTRWCKDEKFKAAMKFFEKEKIRQTLSMLNEGSARATEILFQLAECDDKRVKMEAVKYILDRNLGKTTSKVIVMDENEDKEIDLDELAADIENNDLLDFSDDNKSEKPTK